LCPLLQGRADTQGGRVPPLRVSPPARPPGPARRSGVLLRCAASCERTARGGRLLDRGGTICGVMGVRSKDLLPECCGMGVRSKDLLPECCGTLLWEYGPKICRNDPGRVFKGWIPGRVRKGRPRTFKRDTGRKGEWAAQSLRVGERGGERRHTTSMDGGEWAGERTKTARARVPSRHLSVRFQKLYVPPGKCPTWEATDRPPLRRPEADPEQTEPGRWRT
jgi:hypothetical protein